ncbi:uncharacterized protein LOC134279120 [Saccostrea cucullata]|uniref:uncharacterized protein LOC134279120 n=1 Tax=Saccostrea cuccullata TaxID=36930 RepID=UPI002ED5744C
MKKRQRQNKAAFRDKSVGKETEPRKTYSLRKRKYECGKDVNSTEVQNAKRRRVQTDHSDQRTEIKVTSSAGKRKRHPKDVGQGKDQEALLQDVSAKESLKRKRGKKSKECVRSDVGFKTKIAKRVLRSSIYHTKEEKGNVNKQSYSKQRLGLKKTGDKKRDVQRRNLSEKFKTQSTQKKTTKSIVRGSAHNRKPISKKEEQSRSKSRLNSKAESFKKSKAKTINQTLPKNKRIRKYVQKVQNTVSDAKSFSNLFLNKITVKKHHTLDQMEANIHGISVSEDNLVWVNHLKNTVQLRSTTGEVIRTFELDFKPVFNCCTPSGDILVTEGYGVNAKPTISFISREGDVKALADLSSYASHLCGILCQDERIYVVAAKDNNYFIIKLNMNGEVECVYHTQQPSGNINQIISLNGQIVAIRINSDGFMPLEADHISSRKMNKANITLYSASASVDRFGNVIMASNASLFIINSNLDYMHEIATGTSEDIISTAVDKQNQLWFGTRSGKLYSTKYLK